MSSAYPVSIRQLRGRMARSILFLSLPISLIPVLVLGSMFFLFRANLIAARIPSAQQASLDRLPTGYLLAGALLFILALVVTGLLTWLAAHYLTRPLNDLVSTMSLFVQGNREQRASIDKPNEIGTLARLFNQMANELSDPDRMLSSGETEQSIGNRQAINQLSQLATLGKELDDFLSRALDLIAGHYGCSFAGVYLLERAGPLGPNLAVLRHSNSSAEFAATPLAKRFEQKAIDVDTSATMDWMIRKAIDSMRTQVGPPVEDPGMLEAAFPLIKGEQFLGVLDLFTGQKTTEGSSGSFSSRMLSDLEAIANIVALAIANTAPQDQEDRTNQATDAGQEFNLLETELIYQASHPIAQAETVQQVFDDAAKVLYGSPYNSAILMKDDALEPGKLHIVHRGFSQSSPKRSRISSLDSSDQTPTGDVETGISMDTIAPFFVSPEQLTPRPVIVTDINASPLPQELLEVPRQMGCDTVAFIPVLRAEQVVALLALGKSSMGITLPPFTMQTLGPYINLIELMVMALEKIQTKQGTQRILAELRTIWNISQTISEETNLGILFREIHKQVKTVMGELYSFTIALFDAETDTIRIPYMVEAGKQVEASPFALGEDLISILVYKRRPILLVEDAEAKARALGVWVTDFPARSWLGVPLLFGGEVIGAIIVQDNEHEHRFSEDDEHLLSTLAAQAAVVVRNAWLLETTHHRTEKERLLNEITARIRRSVDIQTILKVTADELGAALGARRAHIEITRPRLLEPASPDSLTYRSQHSFDEPKEASE